MSVDLRGATLVGFVAADCHFLAGSRFDEATFVGETRFGRAVFWGRAVFTAANFVREVRFGGADFGGELSFAGAVFHATAWFDGASVADVNGLHDLPPGWRIADAPDGRGRLVRDTGEQVVDG